MNFDLPPDLVALRDRVAAFIRDSVIPAEPQSGEEVGPATIYVLREKARRAGIYGPQLPPEYGGLGLGTVAMCVPGLIFCGSAIQPARFPFVLERVPAAIVLRLPKCVRSGPTCAPASVPRIA